LKHLFVTPEARRSTKDRLIAAAAELFAEHGFHGTTMRDIAERAGANLAASNYHYGSKKALYLEVLRVQFTHVRAELRRRGAAPPPAQLDRLTRAQLVDVLRSRLRVFLNLLIGPPPSLHGTLMHREMCDPSEALPDIVREFIEPMVAEMTAIVGHLAPHLDRDGAERAANSITGQALFYRFTMPAMLHMKALKSYPRGLARKLADHITDFSLGALERGSDSRVRRRHA
jgi:TetR/AcrR family transcriptional regulator, regulator of cefoperazone and chloramphenicol sensitivity